jgi:hypothetical protein
LKPLVLAPRRSTPTTLALLAALLCLASCNATSYRVRYNPTLAEVLAAKQPGGEPVARVLVSVRGAFREGLQPEGEFALHLRVRVENSGDEPLTFDPAKTQLLNADLAAFGGPLYEALPDGATVAEVAPGDATMLELRFLFPYGLPPKEAGLDGLRFQADLQRGGEAIPLSVTFTRLPLQAYDTWGRGYYSSPWCDGYWPHGYYGYYHAHRWH